MRTRQSFWSSLLHRNFKEMISSPRRRRVQTCGLAEAVFMVLLAVRSTAAAGSATWNLNPITGDWNTASNWTPPTVPNGPVGTATFDLSNTTAIFTFEDTEVDGIVFNADASAFTITAQHDFTLTVSGAGIANNSVVAQNFVITGDFLGGHGTINFMNSATAGNGILLLDAAFPTNPRLPAASRHSTTVRPQAMSPS